MINHGFVKVAAAIPSVTVGDCLLNAAGMVEMINGAADRGVQIVCFPELSVTGYTCGDLFRQRLLIEQAEKAVSFMLKETRRADIIFVIGAPVHAAGKLFNTAIICKKGEIFGIVPKTRLPEYNEFYEKRWFASSADSDLREVLFCGKKVAFGADLLFESGELTIGTEICEDLWAPIPPSSYRTLAGAHIIFNLSASNELAGKNTYLKNLILQQSARCIAGYVYSSSGWGESTTDLVFAGNGIICENGTLLAQNERFSFNEQLIITEIDIERMKSDRQKNSSFVPLEMQKYRYIEIDLPETSQLMLTRRINPQPFVPPETQYDERCREIFSIQTGGLAKRLRHTGMTGSVVGVSGGLDSTLALLVCAKTCDRLEIPREKITGVTMPGYGTTNRTYTNALNLMKSLGVTIREIDIRPACEQHFKDIGHDPSVHDTTFENAQARERMQILMDIANQINGMVIGTGDLSELALGWATYNGDHISMYGVNASIPKTLVRSLVTWIADTQVDEAAGNILKDIINTPVSPELLPASSEGEITQRTEDIIGPYELHDFFLYYMIRFGFSPQKILFLAEHAFSGTYRRDIIRKWLQIFYSRFFSQQFKRSCMPDGPKVGSISLSPRGDWRMPSDASVEMWLRDLSTET